MAIPGFRATIKRGGTPTAFTEAQMNRIAETTHTTAMSLFKMSNTTAVDRTIFDRNTALSFKDTTATTISSTEIDTIDYLFGKVRLKTTAHTTSILVTGSYIPTVDVVGANTFNLQLGGDILDDTDFSSTGIRSRILGLRDVALTLGRWEHTTDQFWNDLLLKTSTGTTVAVVEIRPSDGSSSISRGWFVVEANNLSGSVNDLEAAEISMQIDGDPSTRDNKSFTWSDGLTSTSP